MNILILIIIYQRDILLKNRLNSFDADVKWYFRPIKSAGISFKYLMTFQSIWIWLFILLLKYIVSILYECIWKEIFIHDEDLNSYGFKGYTYALNLDMNANRQIDLQIEQLLYFIFHDGLC